MADITRKGAFEFLRLSPLTVMWSELEKRNGKYPKRTSVAVVAELEQKNCAVFLVDLSNAESLDLGLHVVRAVIPALQPISFHFSARYLAHERLRKFMRNSAGQFHFETAFNSFPLPFA
jgi:ribosomal protein S12 methylthiotransferase accessory factor